MANSHVARGAAAHCPIWGPEAAPVGFLWFPSQLFPAPSLCLLGMVPWTRPGRVGARSNLTQPMTTRMWPWAAGCGWQLKRLLPGKLRGSRHSPKMVFFEDLKRQPGNRQTALEGFFLHVQPGQKASPTKQPPLSSIPFPSLPFPSLLFSFSSSIFRLCFVWASHRLEPLVLVPEIARQWSYAHWASQRGFVACSGGIWGLGFGDWGIWGKGTLWHGFPWSRRTMAPKQSSVRTCTFA